MKRYLDSFFELWAVMDETLSGFFPFLPYWPLKIKRHFDSQLLYLKITGPSSKRGERRDSNPRSPGPQPGALDHSATPTVSMPF